MKSLLVCTLMLSMATMASAADASDPVVSVAGGKVQGRKLAAPGGAVFKGLPFAAPPVGDLRWREPAPVQPWAGVRDAGAFGPDCMQNSRDPDKPAGQEDCLYLNVWTPDLSATAKKPVMFWIYGGGNNAGSASRDIFDGTSLTRKGVVVVSIGYRLGLFGYMAHPGLTAESAHHASGDYGLLDLIAGLRWVRENIARFGGDPDNVTVFGQSAGGGNSAYMLASPLSRGLFHKLIKESGAGAMRDFMPLRDAERVGEGFAASLHAPAGPAGIKFLRGLPADQLQKAYKPTGGLPDGKGVVTGAGGRMEPSIDGYFMPVNPRTVFAAGKAPAIPFLLGSNSIEQTGPEPGVLRKAVAEFYGLDAPKVLAFYGLDVPGDGRTDPLHGSPSLQFQADSQQRCGAVQEAVWHTATMAPVYEYQFSRANPGRPAVAHSSELPYVWGNMAPGNDPAGPAFVETDRKISAEMQSYWTNFAKTGDPNGAGLPSWPKFEPARRPYLDFTDNGPVLKNGLRREICDLYMANMQRRLATSGR